MTEAPLEFRFSDWRKLAERVRRAVRADMSPTRDYHREDDDERLLRILNAKAEAAEAEEAARIQTLCRRPTAEDYEAAMTQMAVGEKGQTWSSEIAAAWIRNRAAELAQKRSEA